jgi:cephalosporin-C deacetylase-like acetyl esterase
MMIRTSCCCLVAGIGLFLIGQCPAQEIIATPKHANGVYAVGEPIEWRVAVNNAAAAPVAQIRYVLKEGGLTVVKKGALSVSSGVALLRTKLDAPNSVLVELTAKVGGKEVKTLVGAVAAPRQIPLSAPRPADFDAFWDKQIEQLKAIAPNAVVERGDAGKPGVDYCKVTLDNIRGSHVYGQLARPHRPGKFPAILLVQYAGIYPLRKYNVVSKAESGWLALNIMAHDLPLDRPDDYYKTIAATTLKDYLTAGNEDREKSYYLRMYLGCYRAVEYLAGRDDWDGRTLVVMGVSQGGLQAIVTAGLHPQVTALIAGVPAGCDTTGPWVGRAGGHPYWYNNARGKPNEKQIMETSRYFDVVNFASRVKCPALVALGLIDQTCPPAGVLSACNRLGGPKEVLILVNSDHKGAHGAQAPFQSRAAAWLASLVKGNRPPIQ